MYATKLGVDPHTGAFKYRWNGSIIWSDTLMLSDEYLYERWSINQDGSLYPECFYSHVLPRNFHISTERCRYSGYELYSYYSRKFIAKIVSIRSVNPAHLSGYELEVYNRVTGCSV